jgi:MSHA biogenesis protein MshP
MSGKNEQGFSLILAIFIMVVFALLLTALVRIETASNLISGAQATAERALMAAQSGAQAGVYQIATPTGGSTTPVTQSGCFSPAITSSSLAGLAGCAVAASCSSAQGSVAAGNPPGSTDFLLTSTGTCGKAKRTVVVGMTNTSCHSCVSEELQLGNIQKNCNNNTYKHCKEFVYKYGKGTPGSKCTKCYTCTYVQTYCSSCSLSSCNENGGTYAPSILNYWLEKLR